MATNDALFLSILNEMREDQRVMMARIAGIERWQNDFEASFKTVRFFRIYVLPIVVITIAGLSYLGFNFKFDTPWGAQVPHTDVSK